MFGFLRLEAPKVICWDERTWKNGQYTGDSKAMMVAKNCIANIANSCTKPLVRRVLDHNLHLSNPLMGLFLFFAGLFSKRR